MRLPRMTIGQCMIVVAVVGLLMGMVVGGLRLKERLRERSVRFQALARYHGSMAQAIRSSHGLVIDPGGVFMRIPLESPSPADHHEELARRYKRAAARPWLSVEGVESEREDGR